MNQATETTSPVIVKDAISTFLSESYLLVSLTATTGPRTKTDKQATAELTASKGAQKGSMKAVKDLWHGASKEIDAIESAMGGARLAHYELTAAFTGSTGKKTGPRLLSNIDLLRDGGYAQSIALTKREVQKQLNAFEQVYDLRMAQAMQNLGGAAKASDYPTFEEYRAACTLVFTPKPVTTVDAWGPSTLMLEAAGQKLVDMTATSIEAEVQCAITDACGRLRDPLERLMKATLPKTDGKYPRFFDSAITNLESVVRAMRSFNLYNDPEIDTVADAIEQELLKYTPDQLRGNDALKDDLNVNAQAVNDMLESMAAFA